MKNRIEALEQAIPEIRERLVRVETKVDSIEQNMATKADLNELKVFMLQGFNNQIKWFIGALTALAGIVFAAIRLIQ
jgi:hypothetical protein